MKFNDIPQLTKTPNYEVVQEWQYLESTIDRYGVTDPDFQRLHVWTEQQQIAYVEYIMRGGKSGRDLYFNQADWGGGYEAPMYLVDGKQRLNAVLRFLRNEIAVFGGHYRRDFEGRLPSAYSFTIHVNDLKTYREVVTWYLEMNAGGTPHTEEELNKARELLAAADPAKV